MRGTVTLSGPVTDLDVTSDGARAVAVVRDTSEVAILPLGAGIPAAGAVTSGPGIRPSKQNSRWASFGNPR